MFSIFFGDVFPNQYYSFLKSIVFISEINSIDSKISCRLKTFSYTKKASHILCDAFRWLDYPDSNQNKQNQNLLCYHYTIVQSYELSFVLTKPNSQAPYVCGAKVGQNAHMCKHCPIIFISQ